MTIKAFMASMFMASMMMLSCSKTNSTSTEKSESLDKFSRVATSGGDNAGTYTNYDIPTARTSTTTKVQVDVVIQQLGNMSGKLLFPAMQVNFGPSNANGEFDGLHIGMQNNFTYKCVNHGGYFEEFTDPNYRYTPFFTNGPVVTDENQISSPVLYSPEPGVSVEVGHFDPGTYTQANEINYNWAVGTKYRYEVENKGILQGGFYRWVGSITNLTTGVKTYVGTCYSKSAYVQGFNVWVETNFNTTAIFDVRWTYPKYTSSGVVYTVDPNTTTAVVSNNRNNSVVVPTQAVWTDGSVTTWHRNGLSVPTTAYKYVKYNKTVW